MKLSSQRTFQLQKALRLVLIEDLPKIFTLHSIEFINPMDVRIRVRRRNVRLASQGNDEDTPSERSERRCHKHRVDLEGQRRGQVESQSDFIDLLL